MTSALGDVNVAPGYQIGGKTTDRELLASSNGGFTQDGVTLAVGQGVLAVGTPLYRFDDGTYGKYQGQADRQVAASVTFTASNDRITTPSAHGLAVGDEVKVASVSATNGVTANQKYYVKSVPSSTTFTVSSSNGGAVNDVTADSTGGALTQIHDDDDSPTALVGFLRREVNTGVAGDIPKFGNRVYKGILKYSLIKAANGGVDLTTQQLTALGARVDANRDYLIF